MRRQPKYVQGFLDRHGRARFYFRRAGFKPVPLPGLQVVARVHGGL
jgi:hypothetical protein